MLMIISGNLKRVARFFCILLQKLLCFLKKRNLKAQENDENLMSIIVQGDKCTEETNLDWDNCNWGEGPAGESRPNDNHIGITGVEDGLFKDMEPVIDKAKVVYVRKKVLPKFGNNENTFNIQSNHSPSNMMNLKYQVDSELGVMDDTNGWCEEVDEDFILKETESMLQNNRVLERERRLIEQKQKKMERELLRLKKKQDNYGIGIKIK